MEDLNDILNKIPTCKIGSEVLYMPIFKNKYLSSSIELAGKHNLKLACRMFIGGCSQNRRCSRVRETGSGGGKSGSVMKGIMLAMHHNIHYIYS